MKKKKTNLYTINVKHTQIPIYFLELQTQQVPQENILIHTQEWMPRRESRWEQKKRHREQNPTWP